MKKPPFAPPAAQSALKDITELEVAIVIRTTDSISHIAVALEKLLT